MNGSAELLGLMDPNDLRNIVYGQEQRILSLERAVLHFGELAEAAPAMGDMRSGRFIATDGDDNPEDATFSGMFLASQMVTIQDGNQAHMAEVLDGEAQFWVAGGAAWAAGGALELDADGITLTPSGSNYIPEQAYSFSISDIPTDTGAFGMGGAWFSAIKNKQIYIWSSYLSPTIAGQGEINLRAEGSDGLGHYAHAYFDMQGFGTSSYIQVGATNIDLNGAIAVNGTLTGYVIGTNVEAWNVNLDQLAGLSSAASFIPYWSTGAGNVWATHAITTAGLSLIDDASATDQRTTLGLGTAATHDTGYFDLAGAAAAVTPTTLGLVIGTNVEAWNVNLDQLAGLSSAASFIPYWSTGAGNVWATHAITTAGLSLIDDASATDQRTTLGLGTAATHDTGYFDLAGAAAAVTPTTLGLVIGTNVEAWNTNLDWLAANITAAGKAILDDANATAQRSTLGLVIGTNVQAWDTDLDQLAALTSATSFFPWWYLNDQDWKAATITAAGLAILDDANAAAQLVTLGALPLAGGTMAGSIASGVYSWEGANTGTIADDHVVSFTPDQAFGIILIYARSPSSNYFLLANYSTGTPLLISWAKGAATGIYATTLAGTTGTDNQMNVGIYTDGKIYIENRTGGSRTFGYVLLGL